MWLPASLYLGQADGAGLWYTWVQVPKVPGWQWRTCMCLFSAWDPPALPARAWSSPAEQ